MHWWIPRPNPTWRFGVRSRSSSAAARTPPGRGSPRRRRARRSRRPRRPARRARCRSVAIRRIACCGASTRTTSSANAGDRVGVGAQARLKLAVAGEPQHGVPDRARRRVVPGRDEHHHDPDDHLVVERRQLGVAADESADDVVAGVAPPLLDQRRHVRPQLLADRDPLRASRWGLSPDLVDPARPVVDQAPVVVGQLEQQAERAGRERVAEARREVAAARGDELVDHLACDAAERLLERGQPLAREVWVEQPPVDAMLGRVALERRAPRVEERHDVAEASPCRAPSRRRGRGRARPRSRRGRRRPERRGSCDRASAYATLASGTWSATSGCQAMLGSQSPVSSSAAPRVSGSLILPHEVSRARVRSSIGAGRPSSSTWTIVWPPVIATSPSWMRLPREADRRPPDRLDPDPQLDLVVEHEHAQVVGLDVAPRVVAATLVEQAELPVEAGLGRSPPSGTTTVKWIRPPASVSIQPTRTRSVCSATRRNPTPARCPET